MIIFPAIDIKGGKCVRLLKGDFKNLTEYNKSPTEQARVFANIGFKNLHLIDLDGALEGKLIKCKHCNDQWIYESKTQYLENRLQELTGDLEKAEAKINLRKKEHQEKISNLENDLTTKKEELNKQKNLVDKITAFENRLKQTEKLTSEEAELDNKVNKIKKEIRTTSTNIESKNRDIEEKTNYIESRINSYNNNDNNSSIEENQKIEVNGSDVININNTPYLMPF